MKSIKHVVLLFAALVVCNISSLHAQLTNWQYVSAVEITENRGISEADYQFLLYVNTADLIGNGQLLPSADDLRFAADCAGDSLLPYYIESGLGTDSTKVWVLLPELFAFNSTTIYMFTGNPAAAPASSQPDVFPNMIVYPTITPLNNILAGTYDYDWFEIPAGVTVSIPDINTGALVINANRIIINGTLDVSGAGNEGGDPGYFPGNGPGAGDTALSAGSGGGAYGNIGGDGGYDLGDGFPEGGSPYGTIDGFTIELGSGGAGTEAGGGGGQYAGGDGGGALTLNGNDITIGGSVLADGNDGEDHDGRGPGGGSGGGILIFGDQIDYSGNMSAAGGDGGTYVLSPPSASTDGGGGGSGGRIKRYYYSSFNNVGTDDVTGGTASFSGASTDSAATDGGDGTVFDSLILGAFQVAMSPLITNNQAPTVTGIDTTCQNSTETYTANATGPVTYLWTAFGGTISGGQNTAVVDVDWTRAGLDTIRVITTSTVTGCEDTTDFEVFVSDVFPNAAGFVFNGDLCTGETILFQDQSTIASGSIVSWFWDFGDNSTSTDQNPTKIYPVAGNYTVTLIVTSDLGCSDTATQLAPIVAPAQASFTATNECLGDTTFFTNTSVMDPTPTAVYEWDFGDGTTSTDTDPTHVYAAPGTYTVTLVASYVSPLGNVCADTYTESVTVYALPDANFNFTSACPTDSVMFQNTSTISSGSLTYEWDFGDALGTSTDVSPNYAYAAEGTYTVTLVATSANGCTDTVTRMVTVYAAPTAGFTATTECEGAATVFTNTTTIASGTLSYSWDFDDGSTSSDINPIYTYAAAGTYNVTLIATSDNGCADTVTNIVTVNAQPLASFTIADASVCDGDSVFATNTSTTSGNDVVFTWSAGDGNFTNDTNVAYLYGGPGVYNVWLAATDTLTGCTDTAFATVTVFDEPVAAFSATTVCEGDATVFTNGSTIGTGTLSYAWNFDDGNTSTDINPVYTYAAAGDYDVTLVVTSDNGCTDTAVVTVTVNPEPSSSFTIADADVCDGDTVFFTNTSTAAGADILYTWSFGDGNTSNEVSPAYLYGAPGNYTVWLAVTDTVTGCTDTSMGSVIVYHEPVAGWTAPNVCVGTAVSFTNTSTLGVGTMSFVWDFGDGTTSTDVNPTHTYTTDSIKTITLTVTTDNGCTDVFVDSITIYAEPVADFSTGPACFGFATTFINTSTIAYGTMTYEWDFGDGNTSTDTDPSHTYASMGVYTVTLTATSDQGCVNTTQQSVTVNPNPSAGFTATTVCEGDATDFTNTSSVPTGNYTSFWDFGDGFTLAEEEPSYTFAAAGDYDVTLVVTSDQGCTDTIIKTVTVIPNPDADFIADPVCHGFEVNFQDVSSAPANGGSVVDVKWFFGDGESSVSANPTHLYDGPGTYLATLVVTASTGCVDTISKAVVVYPLPDTTLRPLGPTAFCDGDSVILTAATVFTYEWSTGDTSQQITVTETGTYCVTVTTAFGCVGDSCIDATKWELPVANAGNDTTVSKGYNAQLVGDGGVDFVWEPANLLDNQFVQFPVAGPMLEETDFVLLVTDTNGCKDTDTVTVFIDTDYLVEATNLITPNGDGKNDLWHIINIETYPDVQVYIFDRWGTLVFESQAYDNTWDGTHDGNELQPGTYYYAISFEGSDRVYKGAVNILR